LTVDDDELSVIVPLDAGVLEEASVALLAGAPESGRLALQLAVGMASPPPLVDLTGAFEDRPESRLREPLLETTPGDTPRDALHSLAHPAASVLARLLSSLHRRRPLTAAAVTVLEPASARGKEGIDELHQQTVNLFRFGELPMKIFDAQASFNLLPRLGPAAPEALAASEQRMERHLASLLGPLGVPLPSLRLVQAPVFHGYAQSVWLRFAARPEVAELEQWLREDGVDVRPADQEPATNLAAAGQSGLLVSDVAADRGDPHAIWLWLVSDNLRTLADNALLVAGILTQASGRTS
jgi:aspartate-semialdehyde dehydrogenase